MYPVTSDLYVIIQRHEAEIELKARQRAALARAAHPVPSLRDRLAGIAAAVRRFVDPRDYALSEASKRAGAMTPATDAPAGTRLSLAVADRPPAELRHQPGADRAGMAGAPVDSALAQ